MTPMLWCAIAFGAIVIIYDFWRTVLRAEPTDKGKGKGEPREANYGAR